MTTGSTAGLLAPAVRNNAAWCDAVCRLHGLDVHFDDALWWTSTRSPDCYPDAVTLDPGVTAEGVLPRVDDTPGCSVKDSFATLDLAPAGFRVLFEAQWIGRPALDAAPGARDAGDWAGPTGLTWRPVREPAGLARWTRAHGEAAALLPAVLARPDLRLFLATDGDEVRGGLALNQSTTAVGVSNLFAAGADPALLWAGVAALAADAFPGQPLVGYEGGRGLAHAERAGFTPLGPLRVWTR